MKVSITLEVKIENEFELELDDFSVKTKEELLQNEIARARKYPSDYFYSYFQPFCVTGRINS